jgi:hypothetical protein
VHGPGHDFLKHISKSFKSPSTSHADYQKVWTSWA